MNTNNELRRSYQRWRILDHLLSKELPAKRYLSQRDKIIQMFLSKKENEVTENKVQEVDRIVNISEKDLKQNYLDKGVPVVMEGRAKNWKCVKQWSLELLSLNRRKECQNHHLLRSKMRYLQS